MRKLSVIVVLCLSSAAYAADDAPSNIFHADLSNPDLAAAVTAFEDVCMPFVLHKTELTRAWDKAHHENELAKQNFVFQSGEVIPRKYLIEPAREEWKPASQALNAGKVNAYTRGQFTVFNGISSQVVHSPTRVSFTGEIIGPVIVPSKYKTMTVETQSYALASDERVAAVLDWNYPSQLYPAKSCKIRMQKTALDKANFTENFLEKDEDWRPKGEGWSQCVVEGDDQFLFSAFHDAKHDAGAVSLSVTRNDMFHKNLCSE